jgi:tetratricopeptide (TPR) repeat protein
MECIMNIHLLTIEKQLMKKLGHILIFCLGIAALVFILQAPAIAEENAIEVKCLDSSNNPVSGVNVQLVKLQIAPNSQKAKEKKSNNLGVALFNKLDTGVYRIVGRKEGLAPVFFGFVQTNGTQQSVAIRLEPGDSAKKLYFEDPMIAQQAQTLLKTGIDATNARKFSDAEKAFRESISLNPADPTGFLYLGVGLIQSGNSAAAEEPLQKALALSDAFNAAYKGTPAEAQFAAIRNNADTILKSLPAIKLQEQGNKAMSEKNFDLAIAKFKEAGKIKADDADTYYNLALAYAQNKNYTEALTAIDQALKFGPNEKDYSVLKTKVLLYKAQDYMNTGTALRNEKDFKGALENFQQALSILTEPKSKAIVYSNIGLAQTDLARYDDAVQSYLKAIEADPERAEYRNSLANCYLKMKKYDEMFNVLVDPKATGGKSADEVLLELGRKASSQADEQSAETAQLAFERAININPENAEATYELGKTLYISKKDDKRAMELLDKYTKIGKNQANISSANDMLTVIKRRLSK